jgi:restriction system protein
MFQIAALIYDATVVFCRRFVDDRSDTANQMVRAARGCRQNTAAGSRASSTSSQTELRRAGVARASLNELLLDYEVFLRQRQLPLWDQDASQAREVWELAHAPTPDPRAFVDPTGLANVFGPYTPWLNHQDPAIVANTVICLIHEANDLLNQHLGALEHAFLQQGGDTETETLALARIAKRERKQGGENSSDPAACERQVPDCPSCGAPMVLRTARRGQNPGAQFWGCTSYPDCRHTRRAGYPKTTTDWCDPTDPTDRRVGTR